MEHWREDWFFGYQFLNGSNPRMIKQIQELPPNLHVSGDMVQAFLKPHTTLEKELKVLFVIWCCLDVYTVCFACCLSFHQ